MPLADYNLPATSAFTDGADAASPRQALQLEGARLMVNERIAAFSAVNPTDAPAEIPAFTAPTGLEAANINTLRDAILAMINLGATRPGWVDEVDFPDGDFSGVLVSESTVKTWTSSSFFSTFGVGGKWTRIPARNWFGYTSSGSDYLQIADLIYKEHINEIIFACQQLKHLFVPLTLTDGNQAQGGSTGEATEADAKSVALTSFNAGGWIPAVNLAFNTSNVQEPGPGSFDAFLNAQSSVFEVDLSGIASGTANLFAEALITGTAGAGSVTAPATPSDPDTWGLWQAASVGGLVTTPEIGKETPTFPPLSQSYGWNMTQTPFAVVAPTFSLA